MIAVTSSLSALTCDAVTSPSKRSTNARGAPPPGAAARTSLSSRAKASASDSAFDTSARRAKRCFVASSGSTPVIFSRNATSASTSASRASEIESMSLRRRCDGFGAFFMSLNPALAAEGSTSTSDRSSADCCVYCALACAASRWSSVMALAMESMAVSFNLWSASSSPNARLRRSRLRARSAKDLPISAVCSENSNDSRREFKRSMLRNSGSDRRFWRPPPRPPKSACSGLVGPSASSPREKYVFSARSFFRSPPRKSSAKLKVRKTTTTPGTPHWIIVLSRKTVRSLATGAASASAPAPKPITSAAVNASRVGARRGCETRPCETRPAEDPGCACRRGGWKAQVRLQSATSARSSPMKRIVTPSRGSHAPSRG
mmetsp:Transcript_9937/g.34343  ORF Transcript_9937/g.34343 Transcript_9937/m.34343 type:complete len:375 (-) Transcript_9937:23-1147(-)